MASGDAMFIVRPRNYIPPGAAAGDFATLGHIVDLSTPPTKTPVVWYDDTADSHADFKLILPPNYSAATGLTVQKYEYCTDGADVDGIELEFRILNMAIGTALNADLGVDTQTAVSLSDTPSATAFAYEESGSVAIPEANFGSVAAEAELILRVTRDVSFAANVDRLGLIGVFLTET